MDLRLSIPYAVDLTKEAGWVKLDKYLYFIARLNLHIEQNQTHEMAFGDILRSFHTTPFSETEMVEGFEEECTVVDIRETTRSAALSDELSQKITGTIAGGMKTPLYEVSSEIGASLEHAVRTSVERSVKSGRTVSRRERKSFTISQKIGPGASELHHAVAGYRKYNRNVFLHYIDYLFVEYKPTTLGLRKKKRNLPRPIGNKHINRIPLDIPLFRLVYWQLQTGSSLLYTDSEYRNLPKVPHPDRVSFEKLHDRATLPLPSRPERPTLYTLSNICFPLRWIDRRGPWTREELENIELEEAAGSAWWYQYGPGRKEKK